ncbi:MAG: hypothetical protein QG635_2456 [Bacteroidota bacterium]|nr:hypothetical protein [Bacteroidota bacterium]
MITNARQHTAIALILFCSVMLFIRLGTGEIQPLLEGANAIRAKAILDTGKFYDQTSLSLGSLKTSSEPPAYFWVVSAFFSKTGTTTFGLRIFTVLCSIGCLILMYNLSAKLFSRELSYLSIALLAGSMSWNSVSRFGLAEIPLMFFILLSLWSLYKLFDSKNKSESILWAVILGISLCLGLLTKAAISLLPLLFLIFFIIFGKNKKAEILSIISGIAGFALASIWYISMLLKYKYGFLNCLLSNSPFSGTALKPEGSGFFYYINDLLISNPFILFSLAAGIFIIVKKIRFKNILDGVDSKPLIFSILSWFILLLISFSFGEANEPRLTACMMPAAILIAVLFYEKYYVFEPSPRLTWILIVILMGVFSWSFSAGTRSSIYGMFSGNFTNTFGLLALTGILTFMLFGLISNIKFIESLSAKAMAASWKYLPALLLLRIAFLNFASPPVADGAAQIADKLRDTYTNSFVYLYHEISAADSLNPQFAFYTEGWLGNLKQGKTYIPIVIHPNESLDRSISICDKNSELLLVYYFSRPGSESELILIRLERNRKLILRTKNYALFGKYFYMSKDVTLNQTVTK